MRRGHVTYGRACGNFLTRFSRAKLIPYVLLFPMPFYKDDDYNWGSD